jgi:hypothetical protein
VKQFKHKNGPKRRKSLTSFCFKVNGAARDTDNNKLHNEKTTKGKRYDRLKRKNISNIVEGKKSLG